jgi:hypothetical protein
MPYLSSEAQTITTDNLLAGISDTFLQLRFATLAAEMPFISTEFASNNWVVETAQPSGRSTQNPYSDTVASGSGGRHKVTEVSTGMLSRNADTPIKDINSASNPNSAKVTYRTSAAKKLAYDFEDEMVNGTGLEPHLHGMEYFLTRYGGFARPNASYNQIDNSWPRFEKQKIFWCDSAASSNTNYQYPLDPTNNSHSKHPLSLKMIDKLLKRNGGMSADLIATTERTFDWIKELYRLESGGNTLNVFKDENLNQRVIDYEGTPIIRLDHSLEGVDNTGVGSTKFADPGSNYGAEVSSGSNVDVTIHDPGANADARWIGFTDLDVGRTVTFDPDGSGNGPEEATIVDVKDRHTATIDSLSNSHGAGGLGNGEDMLVQRTEVMYGLRLSSDHFQAMYNPISNANANAPSDSGAQSIVGFRALEKGEVDAGRKERDAFDWMGTFASRSVYGVSRASHYAPPATP